MTNEYRSLKDHVYNHIVDLIDGGTLADDHKISEQQICDALGVSRTPVREALIQLAADGYLENVPRKGFYVKRVTEDSAREIVEIIGPLDGRAALLAVGDMTDDDIAQLQFLHGSMQLAIEKGLYKKYDDLQHDFHDCYVRKCGNTRLIGLIHQMNRYFMKREYANVGADELDGLLRKANEEHAEIVRLFELRDGEELQRFIRDVHWSIDNAKFLVWERPTRAAFHAESARLSRRARVRRLPARGRSVRAAARKQGHACGRAVRRRGRRVRVAAHPGHG